MSIERWNPSRTYTRQEEWLLKRLRRTRKLFAFLRDHRHEIFDEAMQAEFESMYRDTGAGKDPVCPAMMAMAALMQGYLGVSDAEAVELTVVDLRWQMVLDRLGSTEPVFSQGAFQEFRQRMIRHDMDRRLMEKTIQLARSTEAFDFKKLPKTLRVALDSSPLEGAGSCGRGVDVMRRPGVAVARGGALKRLARRPQAAAQQRPALVKERRLERRRADIHRKHQSGSPRATNVVGARPASQPRAVV